MWGSNSSFYIETCSVKVVMPEQLSLGFISGIKGSYARPKLLNSREDYDS
ncbi:hypothetical protein J41TS4_04930 [Paenibacillus apis]|uniref:Uncharacterized protein n=1 Tax=Paenibacillus apis TaxID=1792174 RepID=A0A920CIL7_9BACL|nr:hypothetical protein J41TS4_04930 [Paenibacillus apis]